MFASIPRSKLLFFLTTVALMGAACSGGASSAPEVQPTCATAGLTFPSPPASQPSGVPAGTGTTIDSISRGAAALDLLSTNSPVQPGSNVYSFDLVTPQRQLITGGSPQVWVAQSRTAAAVGPFSATWYPFTAYSRCHDGSPRTPLPGTYAVTIDLPSPGSWFVAASVQNGTQKAVAVGDPHAKPSTGIAVTAGPVVAQIGTKAISVATPVATTEAGRKKICTRTPTDPLHSISLDRALTDGKPTVVAFATPLLCESRLCGPVVDEVFLAEQVTGPAKANFIHVEEFLPGSDLTPPPPALQNQSPAFKAWHFTTEPWTVIIDRTGVIRARFEGPVTAAEILAALQPLL